MPRIPRKPPLTPKQKQARAALVLQLRQAYLDGEIDKLLRVGDEHKGRLLETLGVEDLLQAS